MNFSALGPGFIDHFFLDSDFRQLPCRNFLQFFLLHFHCRLCIWNFWILYASEWICAQHCNEFIPFAVMWSWWGLCPAPSSLGLVLSSASTTQAYFVLRFPILRCVSPLLFIGILQALLQASEHPTFSERFSLWAWILRRLAQWRIFLSIVWHCRALVSRYPIFVLLSFSLHRT